MVKAHASFSPLVYSFKLKNKMLMWEILPITFNFSRL